MRTIRLLLATSLVVTAPACFTFYLGADEYACDGTGYHDFRCQPTGKKLKLDWPCWDITGKGCS